VGLQVVPAGRQVVADLVRRDEAHLEHQVGVLVAAFVEPADHVLDPPRQTGAVEQHDAELAAGLEPRVVAPRRRRAVLPRAQDLARAERQPPQLGDVAEHLHVGVDVQGPVAMAAQLRDAEAVERELRARAVRRVLRQRDRVVAHDRDRDGPAGVLADRVLQHLRGDVLALVAADEDAHRRDQRLDVEPRLPRDRVELAELQVERRLLVGQPRRLGVAERAGVAAAAVDAERAHDLAAEPRDDPQRRLGAEEPRLDRRRRAVHGARLAAQVVPDEPAARGEVAQHRVRVEERLQRPLRIGAAVDVRVARHQQPLGVARQRVRDRRQHVDVDHVRDVDRQLAHDVVEADAVEAVEVELAAAREGGALADQQPRLVGEADFLHPARELEHGPDARSLRHGRPRRPARVFASGCSPPILGESTDSPPVVGFAPAATPRTGGARGP
jgi:hypothetical protein